MRDHNYSYSSRMHSGKHKICKPEGTKFALKAGPSQDLGPLIPPIVLLRCIAPPNSSRSAHRLTRHSELSRDSGPDHTVHCTALYLVTT